ncbi:unnamed protein product [Cunninghamella echinulata]
MNAPNMGVPVDWECSYPVKTKPYNPKILVGVFTTEDNYYRRQIIRDTYLKYKKTDDIIFKFVIGRTKTKKILEEMNQYHDILPLDIEENMNYGKTYEYFATISETFKNYPLDFNMTYWGYLVGDTFMGGECYGLSFDLVNWIKKSNVSRKYKNGHEDSQVQKWFNWGNINNNITYQTRNCLIHDDPLSNTVYAKEITDKSIVVHYIKTNNRFINIYYQMLNLTHSIETTNN